MKIKHITQRSAVFKRRSAGQGNALVTRRPMTFLERAALAVPFGLTALLGLAGHAMAQATSPTGGLGAQINTMSSEGLNAGSELFGVGCYLAAALCFGFGVWALWQSRQPQNRETGYVGRGSGAVRSVRDRRRLDQQSVHLRVRRQRHREHHSADGSVRGWRLTRKGSVSRHTRASWQTRFFEEEHRGGHHLKPASAGS